MYCGKKISLFLSHNIGNKGVGKKYRKQRETKIADFARKDSMRRLVKEWRKQQVEYPRVSSREVAIPGIRLIKTKSSRQGNKLDTSTRHGTPNISSRPLPPVINKNERNSPLHVRRPDLYFYQFQLAHETAGYFNKQNPRVQTHVQISQRFM